MKFTMMILKSILDRCKTAQMLRLRLDPTAACVPEISANKYVLNIRFLSQAGEDARTRTADWDVPFELTFCNL